MREYEVTIVLRPDLEEGLRSEVIEKVQSALTHGEGDENAPVRHDWGQRSLAYPIKNYEDGYYVFFEAIMDPARIPDIERNILYTDEILRHLVVRKDS